MALFTPQTAREAAAKSHEARRKADQERALILASPPQVAVELVKDCLPQRLDRTRKQIELLDEMIDQADDADVLDALTRSKERLFRMWAHMAGIPGPGNLKPTQPRQTRPQALPTPTPMPVEPLAHHVSIPAQVTDTQGKASNL